MKPPTYLAHLFPLLPVGLGLGLGLLPGLGLGLGLGLGRGLLPPPPILTLGIEPILWSLGNLLALLLLALICFL